MPYAFKKYKSAFDELNVLTSAIFKNASINDETTDMKKRTISVVDNVLSILIGAYRLGSEDAMQMLEAEMEDEDGDAFIEDMYLAVYADIEGKTFVQRVEEHVKNNDLSALQTLVGSEYHRVYNTGLYDASRRFENEYGKESVVKKWVTMQDPKVRETHDYLEGTEVGLDEEFVTFDGDYALYPGGFKTAENNCNCRCSVELKRAETVKQD